jgi:hypothetical protein
MPAPFTNPYQAPDLAWTLPLITFTNPPLRPGGDRHTVIRLCVMWCYYEVDAMTGTCMMYAL